MISRLGFESIGAAKTETFASFGKTKTVHRHEVVLRDLDSPSFVKLRVNKDTPEATQLLSAKPGDVVWVDISNMKLFNRDLTLSGRIVAKPAWAR